MTRLSAHPTMLICGPLLPLSARDLTARRERRGGPAYARELRDLVRHLATEPPYAEALALAGTPAPAELPDDPAELERLALSWARGALRLATQTEPGGLWAGASVAGDSGPPVRGPDHRRAVTVDPEWLDAVVEELRARPEVLQELDFVVHDAAAERGGRVHAPPGAGGRRPAPVPSTATTRLVLAIAASVASYRTLAAALAERFPTADPARLAGTIDALVRSGLLIDDLAPRPDSADPLGHVTARTATAAPDIAAGLGRVADALDAYRRTPVGQGAAALARAQAAMDAVRSREGRAGVVVDLVLHQGGAAPAAVGTGVAAAAEVLWRLGRVGPEQAALDRYLARFVAAYGHDRLVPLTDVVDPVRGIGLPDDRGAPPPELAGERAGLLAELVEAALAGGGELVLTDPVVEELASGAPGRPPRALDLGVHVVAASLAAVEGGRAELWWSRRGPGPDHGAPAGREAQLVFLPRAAHRRHAVHAPTVLGAVVTGVVPRSGDLRPADLWLAADCDRLLLCASGDGDWEQVHVRVPHLLDMAGAPDMARLLAQLGRVGSRPLAPWDWGPLAVLPRLPRVRYGRSVLSPARWRPPQALVRDAATEAGWHRRFAAWRDRQGLPDIVRAVHDHDDLEVDLTSPLHVELVRRELVAEPGTALTESPYADPASAGWSGGYATEVVVSLRSDAPAPALPYGLRPRIETVAHLPGSGWLDLKIYTAAECAGELVTGLPRLAEGLAAMASLWFYSRGAEPRFHLRYRCRLDSAATFPHALTVARHWFEEQRASGLVDDLEVVTYRPEVDRLGGAACLAAAEELFAADSAVCAAQLARRPALPAPVAAAYQYLDLVRSMFGPGWAEWAAGAAGDAGDEPLDEALGAHIVGLTVAAGGIWAVAPAVLGSGGDRWRARTAAASRYGDQLRQATSGAVARRDHAVRSVLHMTHNRLAGLDPASEAVSLRLMRSVALPYCQDPVG
ncbi:MAG TPA: lantibiotic dehydratase [Acidimicrobiales bacterium]